MIHTNMLNMLFSKITIISMRCNVIIIIVILKYVVSIFKFVPIIFLSVLYNNLLNTSHDY